jgi:hypothetical protein
MRGRMSCAVRPHRCRRRVAITSGSSASRPEVPGIRASEAALGCASVRTY